MDLSAIIVTYNESRRLADALKSVQFCEQVLVVDLGSADDCIAIAQAHGAEVIEHPRRPVVEQVRVEVVQHARHPWVLFLDPDEVVEPELVPHIGPLLKSADVAAIELPWRFYYSGNALKTTAWGRAPSNRQKIFCIHCERVTLQPLVHRGFDIQPGFVRAQLSEAQTGAVIRHYWVDSRQELIDKHRRYISKEGEARYQSGQRFSWVKWATRSVGILLYNLIVYRGLLGGRHGIYLSFFNAWYMHRSWLSLRQFQKQQ